MWIKIKAFYAKHPLLSTVCLIAIAGVVFLWLCLLFLDVWTRHGENATVPEVKNMSYDQAREVARRAGLGIEISDSIYDTSVAPGTVVESWPKAGSIVKDGRSIYVTVTAFSPKHVTLSMPITGVSERQAVSYLKALGFTSIRLVNVPSEYPDLVESAQAQGRPIGVGSVIPVDATIVLEVGVAMAEDTEAPADSISAEDAIIDELSQSQYSTYQE